MRSPRRRSRPSTSVSSSLLFSSLPLCVCDCSLLTRLTRTGWDSNPRYPCGHTGFRDRPFQPLTHLSLRSDAQDGETLSGSEDESRGEDGPIPSALKSTRRLGAPASSLRSG